MKVNNVTNTNFKELKYSSNANLYTSTYLLKKDKENLVKAAKKLKNTRFWDLEVSGQGLRVVSRFNKDAFLEDFSCYRPNANSLEIEAIYDGYAPNCSRGKKCSFDLFIGSIEKTKKAFDEFRNSTSVNRAVFITEHLEKLSAEGMFSMNSEGSITKPKNFLEKILDIVMDL